MRVVGERTIDVASKELDNVWRERQRRCCMGDRNQAKQDGPAHGYGDLATWVD